MEFVNTSNIRDKIIDYRKSRNLFKLEDKHALYESTNKPKRRIVDISTDNFIKTFFSLDGTTPVDTEWKKYNRGLFLSYVFQYFDLNLETLLNKELINNNIKPLYKFTDDDNILSDSTDDNEFAMFLFKGGNIMNMYMVKYFDNKFNDLDNTVKKYFSISDFDFTIYFKCNTDERFSIVLEHLEKVTYDILTSINLFFNRYFYDVIKETINIESKRGSKERLENIYLKKIDDIKDSPDEHTQQINQYFLDMNMLLKCTESALTKIYRFEPLEDTLKVIGKSDICEKIIQNEINHIGFDYNSLSPDDISLIKDSVLFLSEGDDENTNLQFIIFLQFINFLNILHAINYYTYTIYGIQAAIKEAGVEMEYSRYYKIHSNIENCNNMINNINNRANRLLLHKIRVRANPRNDKYSFLNCFEDVFVEHQFYNLDKFNELKKNLIKGFAEFADNNIGEYYYDNPKKSKLLGIYGIKVGDTALTKEPDNFIGYNLDNLEGITSEQVDSGMYDYLVDFSNSGRTNNVVNIGIRENSLYSKYNFQNIHYSSVNNSIYVNRDNNESNVSFNLLRTKFNIILNDVNIKNYNNQNETTKMSVPSEFIDISITTLEDSLYHHFVISPERFTNTLDVSFGGILGENNRLLSYNLSYIVADLHHILFKQSNYIPWLDKKYQKRINRLFIMYVLESEDIPKNIPDKDEYKKEKRQSRLMKLFQIFDLIEKVEDSITHDGKLVISANSNTIFNSYLTYRTHAFQKIVKNASEMEENFIYHNYANHRFNDTMMPKLINCICFNIHVYSLARGTPEDYNLIKDYLNLMNKSFLYKPFDNFEVEYLNKIYDITEPRIENGIKNYGKGLLQNVRISVLATLKTFYELPEYKLLIRDIINNQKNEVTSKNFYEEVFPGPTPVTDNTIDTWIRNIII